MVSWGRFAVIRPPSVSFMIFGSSLNVCTRLCFSLALKRHFFLLVSLYLKPFRRVDFEDKNIYSRFHGVSK